MVKIPEEMATKHLLSFKKGDVLLWDNFQGKQKTKTSYFVLLTDCIEGKFLAVRATSQVAFYNGPAAKRLMHDILIIKVGELSLFPKETVLDFTWMNRFTLEDLAKMLGAGITRIGSLSSQLISRLNTQVSMAVTLNEADKKLILSC